MGSRGENESPALNVAYWNQCGQAPEFLVEPRHEQPTETAT